MTASSFISVRLPPDIKRAFEAFCGHRGQTISDTIREWIDNALGGTP